MCDITISVVVCTYNRGKKIRHCLDALINQVFPQSKYEIIVVNDGSTDDTATILQEYDSIRVITNSPNQGLAQSRNNGARASRADIVVFTDDDCVADRHWLKNLLAVYDDSEVAAVGGKIVPYRINHWLLRYYEANNPLAHVPFSFDERSGSVYTLAQYIKRSFSLKRLPEKQISLHMIVGANMSMRRSVFEKVGGFDPAIKFGGEEEDFWRRLHKAEPNSNLVYAPQAVIGHDYDASFRDALRRNYKYGIGAARLYRKNMSRLPVLYPFPVLAVASLILTAISPYFMLLTLALCLGLYSGWLRAALVKKRPQYVAFVFVQLLLELVHDAGFFVGIWKALRRRA